MPAVELLWKIDSASENSSPPGKWKLSNPWRSIGVGVYRAEPSGLCDLPVASELADDI
jgi:hypothetical protein